MRYKLLAATGTTPKDILDGVNTVSIDFKKLNTSTGMLDDVTELGELYATNVNGLVVTPGVELHSFGFSRMCLYSGVGVDEADWGSKFIAGYTIDADGYTFTLAASVHAVRFRRRVDDYENNKTKWYVVKTSDPTVPVFSRLDLGDDQPAMTYQANDIAELKDRQADYSQELTLPLTRHNLSALGLPHHVDSQTILPYRLLGCRLFADEYMLAGRGAVMTVDRITDEGIVCQILGAVAGLFDALSDSPMSDLMEPSFDRDFEQVDPNNTPAGTEFVAASFFKGGYHHILEMDPRYMLPVVHDRFMLEAILSAHGYSLVTNLDYYEGTRPEVEETTPNSLPVVTLDPDDDSFDNLTVSASRTYVHSGFADDPYYILLTIAQDGQGALVQYGTEGISQATPACLIYTSAFDGTCKLTTTIKWQGINNFGEDVMRALVRFVSGGEDIFVANVPAADTTTHSFVNEITLAKGETVVIYACFSGINNTGERAEISVSLDDFSAEEVPLYGKVHIPRNLGFDTQADYVKAFVQRYGLTVVVDEPSKTVYMHTMRKIYENKALARDWSDKYVSKSREIEFRQDGYARSNRLTMQDNEDDNVKDEGSFTIDDTTLEKDKELFSLPFEAGLDWHSANVTETTAYASVPVFEIDSEQETEVAKMTNCTYSGGKPHLLRLSADTVGISNSYIGEKQYHRATHITAQSLIDGYYPELTGSMLSMSKRLKADFYLLPSDIEAFDPFMPVYIRQLGAYFYVNKINNFIAGKLTSVELIKL